MRKTLIAIILTALAGLIVPGIVPAAPDQFIGDTAIYGGQATVLQPNVLVIIDDSGSMGDLILGGSYDPAKIGSDPLDPATYRYDPVSSCSGACSTNAVYRTSDGGSTGTLLNSNIGNITTSCNGANPRNLLLTTGQYSGRRLNSDGSCRTSGSATYVLGNYINWYHSSTGWVPKIQVARNVITNLVNSTYGVKFGLMRFHYPGGTGSASGAEGSEFFTSSVSGNTYVTTVKDMDTIFAGSTTNRDALIAAVATLTDRGYTPLGEALYEAMRYFQGLSSAYGNTVGISSGVYTSPIEYTCQKNYVIFVTDGMDTASNNTNLDFVSTTYSRYDGGGCTNPPYTTCANDRSHSLPGVAKYLFQHDLKTGQTLSTSTTQNNVITYTIGFGLGGADQEAIDLLQLAADSNHGRGKYFLAGSEAELSAALSSVISDIFSVDTSFVAPVVPVNPENRTQVGSRIYMGFFKPEDIGSWSGNLKKFGLNSDLYVVDANNNLATYADANGDGLDDRDGANLASDNNAVDGSFRSSAQSYWNTVQDGGSVKSGGAGQKLLNRVQSLSITDTTASITGASPRNIYTYTGGTVKDLTHIDNAFTTQNVDAGKITAALMGLPGDIISTATTTDVKQLINYIHGFDVYDKNANGNKLEARDWVMGDILHAKPTIIRYSEFDYTQESTAANNSLIFVGTNDGMLHAFRDYNGSEAWAFIPPDVLPNLQYLKSPNHTYFVDSTIQYYRSPSGNAVVLLVGLRRGGGVTTEPNKGFYYALDVTNPDVPKYLWTISNTVTGFTDLGEAWSEPKMTKIKVGGSTKIVAFFGGGYDNCNEDARYGTTGRFSGSCVGVLATSDGGLDGSNLPITSSPHTITPLTGFSSAQYKGRGLYAVEIATLSGTNATLASAVNLLWSYTFNAGRPLEYSMLSELLALSVSGTGYADRLYMGDSGGNMWRINISSTNSSAWTVTKIFNSNPGYAGYPTPVSDNSRGRKIFYKPDGYVVSPSVVRLYFGTGDREHPLNRAVTDRLYGLVDKGQASAVTEAQMLDVTIDQIQSGTAAVVDEIVERLNLSTDSTSSDNYGWYIRLDGADRTPYIQYSGEKVLAGAAVAGGAVYYTTYTPNPQQSTDPCQLGNLGIGSLFAVDAKYGSAVANYDTTNDGLYGAYSANKYALSGDKVLLRTDRRKQVGTSIPSGPVVLFPPPPACATPPCPPTCANPPCKPPCDRVLVGAGGGLNAGCGADNPHSPVQQMYWRLK